VVARWLHTHLPDAPPTRRALLRHASRTLIKQGDPAVLHAWGLGTALVGQASLTLSAGHVVLGSSVTLRLQLQSTSRKPQPLAVDYVVHHVKANGSTSPKVFKGWKLVLPPHGHTDLIKRHPVRPITTRRYHAGEHRVVVQANGQVVAEATFVLLLPTA
jgi:hypothetical protein